MLLIAELYLLPLNLFGTLINGTGSFVPIASFVNFLENVTEISLLIRCTSVA